LDSTVVVVLILAAALLLSAGSPTPQGEFVIPASDADVTLLARLIDVEARGEPFQGKVAVGAVVVNRVKDPRFPNTIRDVIYEPNQFAVGGLHRFPVPSEESRRAAIAALRGEDPTRGALFFYNPDKTVNAAWWATRPARMRIGNHVFTR
jgi:Cell wall hydrolyses involved in spore germination